MMEINLPAMWRTIIGGNILRIDPATGEVEAVLAPDELEATLMPMQGYHYQRDTGILSALMPVVVVVATVGVVLELLRERRGR